jgi:hypothetical protein
VGCFGEGGLPKASQQPGQSEDDNLKKAAAQISLETARAATADWPERLKACVEAKGGHFE